VRNRRFRRLIVEQFEERCVLATAYDDYYVVDTNTALTQDTPGAWSNDNYNASWEEGYWNCTSSEWHDGYWESPVWHDGYWSPTEPVWHDSYWEYPVWYDGYWDENNEWHDGYWDPPEPVWHEAYWEYPVWYEGHWDYDNPVWHDGYWECTSEEWIVTGTGYANGSIGSGPSYGTLTYTEEGARAFTYVPNSDFVGTDSFTYYLNDDQSSGWATVTIQVGIPPEANDDHYTTALNSPLAIAAPGVLDNDNDPGGASLSAELITGASHGSLSLNADGSFLYTPSTTFHGVDSFTYRTSDGLLTDEATVILAVSNQSPVAVDDSFSTPSGVTLVIDAPRGLLVNDLDPDGDSLTVTSVAGLGLAAVGQSVATEHGIVSVLATGALSFIPVAGFSGMETIPITIGDGDMIAEGEFTVSVGIVATDINLITPKNTPITSRLLAKITTDDPPAPALATWTQLNLPTTIGGSPVTDRMTGTMMMLTDGTVMVQGWGVSKNWYRLTPNSNGSYTNAGVTWSKTSMNTERLYFGSNILPNGKLFLMGGEYTNHTHVPTFANTGEIFDPLAGTAGTWSDNVAPFPKSAFGDQSTILLPSGKILGSYIDGPETYLYDYTLNTWSPAGVKLRNERGSETNWALLPDGGVLSYDIHISNRFPNLPGFAQRYDPILSTWVDAGRVPTSARLSSTRVANELGAGVLLPNGKMWFIGADPPIDANGNYKSGAHTALFDLKTNTWEDAFADIPVPGYAADDAPLAPLPNGDVIFTASVPNSSGRPREGEGAKLFRYNYLTGGMTDLTATPGFPSGLKSDLEKVRAYDTRMLVLPTGQVLIGTGESGRIWAYSPSDPIPTSSRPTISGLVSTGVDATTQRETFVLTGQRLNGITEGAAYGDDAEMSTNFPVVQLTNVSTGAVVYARTFDWTPGVATGDKQVTTKFDFPIGLPNGEYRLRVIANGIASDPVSFTQGFTNPTFSLVPNSGPSHGTVSINSSTGAFTYTPAQDYVSTPQEPDSFQYQVNYGNLPAAAATVTIDVRASAVTAIGHAYNTPRLTTLAVDVASGLLSGATGGGSGHPLSITNPTLPLFGLIFFDTNGSFRYVPKRPSEICPGENPCTPPSQDSFTYKVTDGTFTSAPATVTIRLDDPEETHAVDDVYMIAINDYLLVDGGRTLLYPIPEFTNAVPWGNLGYLLNDVLTIGLADVNVINSPIAGEQFLPLDQVPSGINCPWGCGVSFFNSGNFFFNPPPDFIGTKTFQYTYRTAGYPQFNIPEQVSSPGTVKIIVVPRPIATTDSYDYIRGTILERELTDEGLLSNDVKGQDPDNGNQDYDVKLSINSITIGATTYELGASNHVVVDIPNVGQLIVKDDGRFGFSPAGNFNQDFTFSYQIDNGLGQTQFFPLPDNYMFIVDSDKGDPLHHRSDFVTVTLHPKAFVAQDDTYSAYTVAAAGPNPTISVPASKGLMANDSIAAIVVNPRVVLAPGNPPAPGNLSVANDGSFSFTPNANFTSAYTFNYTITSDNSGSSNEATVTLNPAELKATDDEIPAQEGLQISRPAPGVLANDSGATGDTLSAVSVPPTSPNFVLQPDGSFTYTPATGFHGVQTFSYYAQSSYGPTSNTATITFRVRELEANRPVAVGDSYSTAMGTTLTRSSAQGLLSNDTDPNDPQSALKVLSVSKVLLRTGGGQESLMDLETWAENGSFTFTPPPSFLGTATFTYVSTDGDRNSDPPGIVTISIITAANNPPSFTKGPDKNVNEDAGAQSFFNWATGISAGPAGESGQAVTFQVTGNNNSALFSAQPQISPTGTLTFTPAQNANGSATITIVLQDNGGTANGGQDTSAPQTFTVNVTAVNDAPTFTNGPDKTVTEDVGAQSFPNWASAISAGPADESGQTLTFLVIENSNSALFSAQPQISPTGTLTFTPALNANGSATITIVLQDNGGTDNGGLNTSAAQTFTITIIDINDAPAGTDVGVTTLEDQAHTFSAANFGFTDPLDSPPNGFDSVKITTLPANGALTSNGSAVTTGQFISVADINAGLLRFAAAANANGSPYASFTFQVKDNGGTANGGTDLDQSANTLTINVTSVNDPPLGADRTINHSSTTTVGNQGIYGFTTNDFAFTDPNDNPSHNFTGFILTTLPDSNLGWLSLGGNTVHAGDFIPANLITALYFQRLESIPGTADATFTFQVKDDGGTANGGNDLDPVPNTITILLNHKPTITIPASHYDAFEDTPFNLHDTGIVVADIDAGDNEVVASFQAWPGGHFEANPGQTGAAISYPYLPFTQVINLTGTLTAINSLLAGNDGAALTYAYYDDTPPLTATITVLLYDQGNTGLGGPQTAAKNVTVSIAPVNDKPVFNKGPNQSTTDEAGAVTVTGWATGRSAIEPGQSLTFIVTTDRPDLFSVQPAIDAETGTLTYTPAPNVEGTATVTVRLKDDGGGNDTSDPETFTIFVDKPFPWFNAVRGVATQSGTDYSRLDVDNNGAIWPIDAYLVINYINAYGSGAVPSGASIGPNFFDTDHDNHVSPSDALEIINYLNAFGHSPSPWYNAAMPADVSGDGHVVAGDMLDIINYRNAFGDGPIPSNASAGPPYYDTNNDLYISRIDIIVVKNVISGNTHVWRNSLDWYDVNANGQVTTKDYDLILDYLNDYGEGDVPSGAGVGPLFFDVNGDDEITAEDADAVWAQLGGG
jgi:VCBS repeat-containing protein